MKGGVVVTGGAGALGTAVVRRLLDAGTAVVVPYRRPASWEALRAAVGAGRDTLLHGVSVDLLDPASTRALFAQAVHLVGRLDGVAALAGGFAGSGTLEQLPASEFPDMLRTNLETTYLTCREALPHLIGHPSSVVTVSSRYAETAGAGAAGYVAAKAAVSALTRALAAENRERGVRFNCVVPGIVDTAANREAMPGADRAAWTPPAAVAEVVAFLLSPQSSAVSGAVVPCYG